MLASNRALAALALSSLVLIAGGFLAILPVFGLWMIPLGIAVAALDVRPILKRLRGPKPPRPHDPPPP